MVGLCATGADVQRYSAVRLSHIHPVQEGVEHLPPVAMNEVVHGFVVGVAVCDEPITVHGRVVLGGGGVGPADEGGEHTGPRPLIELTVQELTLFLGLGLGLGLGLVSLECL